MVYNQDVVDSADWAALDVPYVAEKDIVIEAPVTIAESVEFQFTQSTRLRVLPGGSLNAVGDEGRRITFRGTNEIPGFWDGVEIDSNSDQNRLEFVDITNGGSSGYANVYMQRDSRLAVRNTTISESETFGIEAEPNVEFPEFTGNTFASNGSGPMRIPVSLLDGVDETSSYAGGSGPKRITVYDADITGASTWSAMDVPVFFEQDIFLETPVTVDPGAEFRFGQSTSLVVRSGASLNALSNESAGRTRFVGDEDVAGYWWGIQVIAASTENVLDYCEVANGGEGSGSNVYVERSGSMTVVNSVIRDCSDEGIYVEPEGGLTESDNQFSGNANGNVVRA